jgi:hypothetical protein
MNQKTLLAVLAFSILSAIPRDASSDDERAASGKPQSSLYLHLLATHRARHHDPDDWRPSSTNDSLPGWSCVATILVYDDRDFYFRAPGNRDPNVKMKGRTTVKPSSIFDLQIEYELDDSNLTYVDSEKFQTKLDRFINVAGGTYWRAILSRNEDAYEAFDLAEKNAVADTK